MYLHWNFPINSVHMLDLDTFRYSFVCYFYCFFFLLFLHKRLYISLLTLCLIIYSCLIARNLLSGLKTCMEVSSYMRDSGSSMPHKSVTPSSFLEETGKADTDYAVCTDIFLFSSPFLGKLAISADENLELEVLLPREFFICSVSVFFNYSLQDKAYLVEKNHHLYYYIVL